MIYGSVCSGIEAATMAWHPLGWTPAFFSEIEAFPSAVLAHHYGSNMPGEPLAKNGIPNHGDFTAIGPDAGPIDLLVGGTPCQSFSVAGKRLGLDDPRGNLALEYLALARRLRARWIVWENVPGVLSSHTDDEQGEEDEGDNGLESADFATFLSFVQECGYGFAYRVLDAQYIRVDDFARAVPQRRRRVFLVGYLGDWRRAAAVLLEPEGMRGDTAPRREAGKSVARSLTSRASGGGGGPGAGTAGSMLVAHALRGEGFDASEDGTGRGTPIVPVFAPDTAATLTRGAESSGKGGYAGRRQEDEVNMVAYGLRADASLSGQAKTPSVDANGVPRLRDAGFNLCEEYAPTIETGAPPTVACYVSVAKDEKTLQTIGIKQGDAKDASQEKTDAVTLLRRVRDEIGAEAFTQWGLGIFDSLQSPEVLRSEVHGLQLRQEAQGGSEVVGSAPPSEIGCDAGSMREMRCAGRARCAPSGPRLSEQRAAELGAYLSKLPQSGASIDNAMQDLWRSSQGLGVLREALSALQEVRRPDVDETKPTHSSWAVRRLTPTECERLMGFPDNFTNVPWRGKDHAPDGPRYKALGNSMACNAMRWIGQRIDIMEKLIKAGSISA